MKSSKKKYSSRQKKYFFLFGIAGVLLLAFLVYFLFKLFQPVYKIEDRLGKMEEKQEVYKEKIVGWLKVQGTNIDYPVIYNADELDLNSVNYDFSWTNDNSKKLGNRELILGHNILNVSKNPLITDPNHSRFEQLMSFIYSDFAKENEYIQYTKDGKNHIYKIFAVGFIDDDKLSYYGKNYNKEKLREYINISKKNSFYNYDVDVNSSDDILSLVTCTRFYGIGGNINFRVDARKLRKNEPIRQYKLAESTKYDKIREEMKGDEADEKV